MDLAATPTISKELGNELHAYHQPPTTERGLRHPYYPCSVSGKPVRSHASSTNMRYLAGFITACRALSDDARTLRLRRAHAAIARGQHPGTGGPHVCSQHNITNCVFKWHFSVHMDHAINGLTRAICRQQNYGHLGRCCYTTPPQAWHPSPGLAAANQHLKRRASRYQFQGQELYNHGVDGKLRLVPKSPECVE